MTGRQPHDLVLGPYELVTSRFIDQVCHAPTELDSTLGGLLRRPVRTDEDVRMLRTGTGRAATACSNGGLIEARPSGRHQGERERRPSTLACLDDLKV